MYKQLLKKYIRKNTCILWARHCRSFPGATVEQMEHYIVPTLYEDCPDVLVLHVGSNNIINRTVDDVNLQHVAQKIINIGKQSIESGVKFFVVSSIFGKRNVRLSARIRELNDILKGLCELNNFIFLSHNEIRRHHLHEDGVHLTDDGTDVYASSILDTINGIYNRRF